VLAYRENIDGVLFELSNQIKNTYNYNQTLGKDLSKTKSQNSDDVFIGFGLIALGLGLSLIFLNQKK
jgi:hypothetical protein